MNTPWYLCHQCPCPHAEPQLPPASPEDRPRPAGRSGPGSYEVTAFAVDPKAQESLCALSKNGVSVSPSFVELLHLSPTGLHSQMLWALLFLMPDPPGWGA